MFWPLAALVLPVFNTTIRWRLRGELPKTGPFILAPNHFTEIDPLIMGIATWKYGRAPRFMAKASLFRVPVLGWVLRKTGQVPVERDRSNLQAMSAANDLIEHGRGVIVYPEGSLTRDPDMWPMRGRSGAVRLALQKSLDIYPAAHWGTQEVMARYGKRVHLNPFKRKTIEVSVGKPVDLSAYRGRPITKTLLEEATDAVMRDISALLSELRHEPAPAERWNPKAHNQTETGRFEGGAA